MQSTYKDQKQVVKRSMNKHEWTQELDAFLMQSVIRNYFNFEQASLEINQEAKNRGLDFGSTHVFSSEKCRIRWSYLHLQRKMGKTVIYKVSGSASESDTNKENTNQANMAGSGSRLAQLAARNKPKEEEKKEEEKRTVRATKIAPKAPNAQPDAPKKLLDAKNFSNVTEKQKPKTMAEIEANIWKDNVKAGRTNKDFLDTSTEDFAMHKTRGVDGAEIIPSSFNIFRDSLRKASERLLETLNENLPDMNLAEIEESESDRDDGGEDEDVLPLDFRTALIEKENRVVIQAKPLQFKTTSEEDGRMTGAAAGRAGPGLDAYLEMVRKEAFREDEGAIMIDPDINIKEKFEQIDLPCNREDRINNTFNAPLRQKVSNQSPSASGEATKKRGPRGPKSLKTYDTDTDTNPASASDREEAKQSHRVSSSIKDQTYKFREAQTGRSLAQAQAAETFRKRENSDKPDPFAFEHSLKHMGLEDVDQLIGHTESKSEHQKKGIVGEIISQNRAAAKRQETENLKAFSNADMLDGLEDVAEEGNTGEGQEQEPKEESDVAPVSPYADALTAEEQAQQEETQRKQQFLNAVKAASSASETDEAASGSEAAGKKVAKLAKLQQNPTQGGLAVVKEASSSSQKSKRVKYYKGQRVMSETEDTARATQPQEPSQKRAQDDEPDDPEAGGSSRSSHGSADEYFDQQRKLLRNKRNLPSKANEEPQPVAPQEKAPAEEESASEDEGDSYAKRLEQERQQQLAMIKKKKAEAEARREQAEQAARVERLKQQEAMQQAEQDKKRKEKDELMQRLKEQDQERKRRKREEKEKKEQEFKRYREALEEKQKEEEEQQERERAQQREVEDRKDRERRRKEGEERMKEQYEQEITSEKSWLDNGKTDIPCLFDKKCAYMGKLHVLPPDLELKIQHNEVVREEPGSGRYKSLMIPLDLHVNNAILSDLIQYFLLFSTLDKVYENVHKSLAFTKESFPFKCISMQIAVTEAPLRSPSLKPMAGQFADNKRDSSIRVLSLLFDTRDEPKLENVGFQAALDGIQLSKLLNGQQIHHIKERYPQFINGLATKYFRQSRIKDFPFEIKSANAHSIEFANESDLSITSTSSLSQIAFFTDFTRQDDAVPACMKESWEFFRRCPSFFAFNANKPSYSQYDPVKKRVVTKNNHCKYENVCVVFKDMSFDPLVECKAENSLAYFFKKALSKNGLDICGLRLVYLDEKNREEYRSVFHESIEMDGTWGKPVLAVVLRGLEATRKVESILGHFNPEMARRTDEKSLRACFGRSRQQNCALQIFQQSRKNLDIHFWFGGRVPRDHLVKAVGSSETAQKENEIMMLVPNAIEKQLLFVSPSVPTPRLAQILQRLTVMGATVLDIHKLDFSQFQYKNGNIEKLQTEAYTTLRGRTYKTEVGFVIKVARENLCSHFASQTKFLERDLDGLLEAHTVEQLLFLTSSGDEYKRVLGILKKTALKTNYLDCKAEGSGGVSAKKRKHEDANYDSEDPEEFSHINLYNTGTAPVSATPRKTKITPIKKKLDPASLEQKYKISTVVCFIKVSSFKKQVIGSTMHALLNLLDVELLGLRFINAKKQVNLDSVPIEVRNTIKSVACKFHQSSKELRLRKKMKEFKTLALVLRGQDVENKIGSIYDREKMKFTEEAGPGLEEMSYETNPHVVFLTNIDKKKPIIDFITETKYIKLYQDMKQNYNHLNSSVEYYEQMVQPNFFHEGDIDTSKFIEIKQSENLLEQHPDTPLETGKLSSAICIIKPNQPFNVILRSLKAMASINPEGLTYKNPNYIQIQQIECIESYSQVQIDLLFEHDIMFDENISQKQKLRMKNQYQEMFDGKPVWQVVLRGQNAVSKLKGIIGNKNPGQGNSIKAEKDTLRSFYGIDRFDNSFFISETILETQIEEQVLFNKSLNCEIKINKSENWEITQLTENIKTEDSPINLIQMQNQFELALIVISPSLVRNNDFVYIMDEFLRSKFNLCAVKKMDVIGETLQNLFSDLVPRTHSLDTLEGEFKRGESVMLVLEKQKAITEAEELIGKFSIKLNSDYEKKKQMKKTTFQFTSHGLGKSEEDNLISEFGSYIFCFPNAQLNKNKISREFRCLPNSKHFKMQRIN